MGGESYPLAVGSADSTDRAANDRDDGYALLDAGDGRRLERFGDRIVDRPAPGAFGRRRESWRWQSADLRFEAGRGWSGRADVAATWPVRVAGLTLELRATTSGGVGLYPEHAANVPWLQTAIRAREPAIREPLAMGHASSTGPATRVLNLFAHTGLATLAAARAGAAVAHVDGGRAAVAWARRNAALNGLADREIRWLVDDAAAFTEREARRGRRYDGVILDPPSSGHAGSGRWTLREGLAHLLEACAAIATDDAFVLLTAHSTGLAGEDLAAPLLRAFGRRPADADILPLELVAESGAVLDLGWAIRLGGPRAADTAP